MNKYGLKYVEYEDLYVDYSYLKKDGSIYVLINKLKEVGRDSYLTDDEFEFVRILEYATGDTFKDMATNMSTHITKVKNIYGSELGNLYLRLSFKKYINNMVAFILTKLMESESNIYT